MRSIMEKVIYSVIILILIVVVFVEKNLPKEAGKVIAYAEVILLSAALANELIKRKHRRKQKKEKV